MSDDTTPEDATDDDVIGFIPGVGLLRESTTDIENHTTINDIRAKFGLPITSWGVLTIAQMQSLSDDVIYRLKDGSITVEQVQQTMKGQT